MEQIISIDGQGPAFGKTIRPGWIAREENRPNEKAAFPLCLAREGEWVQIIALKGGKGLHDRLAGMGLQTGVTAEVIQNRMDGKLLLGHDGARLFLGGGMAQKIQVIIIKGDGK